MPRGKGMGPIFSGCLVYVFAHDVFVLNLSAGFQCHVRLGYRVYDQASASALDTTVRGGT